jgi:hypothetical protein
MRENCHATRARMNRGSYAYGSEPTKWRRARSCSALTEQGRNKRDTMRDWHRQNQDSWLLSEFIDLVMKRKESKILVSLVATEPPEPSVESSASESYHGKNLAWVPRWCQRMTMTGKVSPRVSKRWCLFRTVQYCKWHRVNWIALDLWLVSIPSATQRGRMTSHTHGSDWPTSLRCAKKAPRWKNANPNLDSRTTKSGIVESWFPTSFHFAH